MVLRKKLKKSVGSTKAVRPVSTIKLPTTRNVPSTSLSDYSMLLYGAKKIGKTSLASKFPDAYFLSFEPGTRALKVFSSEIKSWRDFTSILSQLEAGQHKFRTIVVDTVDIMYERAWQDVCEKKHIQDPADENDFGRTFREIETVFSTGFYRLMSLDLGIIFVSHDEEKEITMRDGSKIDRVQPTMHKRAMKVIEAPVDIIANYCYNGSERYLRIDGAEETVSGNRLESNFRTTSGERVSQISMGTSSDEAYAAFIAAFENKQTKADATVTAAPQKRSVRLKNRTGDTK